MNFFLIFLIVLCALYYLPRILLPFILRMLGRKMQRRYANMQNEAMKNQSSKENVKQPPVDKKVDESIGEYIDYEEIK